MDEARIFPRNAPVHTWGPSGINLKPEDPQMQVGKLAKKYDILLVVVTLEDGFGVPQVELISDIKFLRILRKEDLAPFVPEVLYFLVRKTKLIQKHRDKTATQIYEVVFHLRCKWHSPLCAVLPTCQGFACQLENTFLLRHRWYWWPIYTKMRSKRFCTEDRTFLSEGKG